jgi:hypothetical protein
LTRRIAARLGRLEAKLNPPEPRLVELDIPGFEQATIASDELDRILDEIDGQSRDVPHLAEWRRTNGRDC